MSKQTKVQIPLIREGGKERSESYIPPVRDQAPPPPPPPKQNDSK